MAVGVVSMVLATRVSMGGLGQSPREWFCFYGCEEFGVLGSRKISHLFCCFLFTTAAVYKI
jgi:hypothetical protein